MSTLAWVLLVVAVAALLLFDLKAVGRGKPAPSLRERRAVVGRVDRAGGRLHRRARGVRRRRRAPASTSPAS